MLKILKHFSKELDSIWNIALLVWSWRQSTIKTLATKGWSDTVKAEVDWSRAKVMATNFCDQSILFVDLLENQRMITSVYREFWKINQSFSRKPKISPVLHYNNTPAHSSHRGKAVCEGFCENALGIYLMILFGSFWLFLFVSKKVFKGHPFF